MEVMAAMSSAVPTKALTLTISVERTDSEAQRPPSIPAPDGGRSADDDERVDPRRVHLWNRSGRHDRACGKCRVVHVLPLFSPARASMTLR